MSVQKIDPKVIFASNAPAIDNPPVFGDKTKGWDVSRVNNGRPKIPQMNKIQQDTDLKILWLNENAVLPYDASIDYPDGVVVLKDGEFQKKTSDRWVSFNKSKPYILEYYKSGEAYPLNARIMLANGDIVKNTLSSNTNNPNTNMAGWEKDESKQYFVNSISELLAVSNPKDRQLFQVKSRDLPNYDLNHPYSGGGLFEYSSTSTLVANDGTVFDYPSGGKFIRIYQGDVKISWFAGHGGTDENKTIQVQKAFDFANKIDNACALECDGKYTITQLMIDRLTDTTKGTFVVYATGNNYGFRITSPSTMFSSRLPYNPNDAPAYTKAPCSEFTTFRGINFEATEANEENCVFDDKFLRLTFENCTHNKIRGCKEAEYLQSIKWVDCGFRQHVGYFVQCNDAYDVRCYEHRFENSQRGFRFTGIARGCHFNDGLYQGCLSPFINATGLFGCSINDNYFEQNQDAEIVIGTGGGVSGGYTINGNIFMLTHSLEIDPNFYPIQVGLSRGFSMNGNLSSGNLANTDSAELLEISDGGNVTPTNRKVLSKTSKTSSIIIPTSSTTQDGAYKLNRLISIVNESPETNAAVILPLLNNFMVGDTITIINNPVHALYIFPNTGQRILGVGYNQAHQIGGSGTKITLAKSDGDYWLIM